MKKWMLISLFIFLLSGCVSTQGNYQKNRSGYAIREDWMALYRTNSIGQIDSFIIDQLWTLETALKIGFPGQTDFMDSEEINRLTVSEIETCEGDIAVLYPRFIAVNNEHYVFYQESGYDCGYYAYDLLAEQTNFILVDVSTYLGELSTTINPFTDVLAIEMITINSLNFYDRIIWSPLPMSLRQAGNTLPDSYDYILQLDMIQRYLIENQSINRLILREDISEIQPQIWSEETIETLGRNHEIIRSVDLPTIVNVLNVIDLALERLGMFR